MKLIAFVLIAAFSALIAAVPVQDSATDSKQKPIDKKLMLSLHFLDGLSAKSDDNMPDIRFLHYGCHLSLLLTNKAGENVTLWKPDCPEGDSAIRIEFKKTSESKTVGVARISHAYTGGMGIPKTFTLVPSDSLVHRVDLSSYWSLPFVLNDGDDTTVFVRAVYESDKAESKRSFLPKQSGDVWVGKIETDWTEVRLSNVSGKPVTSRNDTNILK